jgi:hypothetical protein
VNSVGDVIVTGSLLDLNYVWTYYTAKYSSGDGALLWEVYSHEGSEGNGALTLDSTGNAIIAGGSSGDLYAAKYAAADGAVLWEARRPGGFGAVVKVDASGNAIVSGRVYADNDTDFYTVKLAGGTGELLWERRDDGAPGHGGRATAMALDGNGNVIVTGIISAGSNEEINSDFYTAKYAAADGAKKWVRRYSGPFKEDDEARAVAVDAAGNAVVAGFSVDGYPDETNFYTVKYAAANGTPLWERRYTRGGNCFLDTVVTTGNGDFIVGGTARGNFYTARYGGANGAVLWETAYDATVLPYSLRGSHRTNSSHAGRRSDRGRRLYR